MEDATAKRLELVLHTGQLSELVAALQQALPGFLQHRFVRHWQQAQFKQCLDSLVPGELCTLSDFAENLIFQFAEEVQSLHWTLPQRSLLSNVAFWRDEDGSLRCKSLQFFSDDMRKDACHVQV